MEKLSILKMKFISIVGRKDYFEEFVYKYIINSGMQLENAISKLENIKGLSAYNVQEPYNDLLKRITSLIDAMSLKKEIDNKLSSKEFLMEYSINSLSDTAVKNINEDIQKIEDELKENTEFIEKNQEEINKYHHMQKQLELLKGLEVDLHSFFNFEYIKFRFGRIPKKSYRQLQLYIDDLNAIVHPVSQDEDYIWIIYFTPKIYSENVDGILSSLYFERIWLPNEFNGTPAEALEQLKQKLAILQNQQKEVEVKIEKFLEINKENVINNYLLNTELNRIYEARKYAACTKESFYITG